MHKSGPSGFSTWKSASRADKFVIGGGVAFALSPFLTWVKVVLLGNLSLFQLFTAANESDWLAWAAVLCGGGTAIATLRSKKASTVWRAGLAVGFAGGILAVYALASLRDAVEQTSGLATLGIGPYVSVAGCVAMVVGGLMARQAR